MAKRIKVGSVNKGKVDPATGKPKPDYIQLNPFQVNALKGVLNNLGKDETLYINLESKVAQLASLDNAVANGKLDEAYAEKQKGFLEKMPEFVRFELIVLDKNA